MVIWQRASDLARLPRLPAAFPKPVVVRQGSERCWFGNLLATKGLAGKRYRRKHRSKAGGLSWCKPRRVGMGQSQLVTQRGWLACHGAAIMSLAREAVNAEPRPAWAKLSLIKLAYC